MLSAVADWWPVYMVAKPVVVLSSVVELVQPVVVLYPFFVELRSAAVVVISAATPLLDGHERGRP